MALIIDNTSESLTKLSRALKNTAGLNKVTSDAVSEDVQNHFRAISGKQKNKFSRPPTFWNKMINSVRPVFSATSSFIEMNRAVALRYFGGIVRPTGNRKFLTIPVNAKAYGRSAKDFPGMFVVRFSGDGKNGRAFLAIQDKKGDSVGPGKKDKLTLMFLLKSSTKHKADKSVLPTESRIKQVMTDAVRDYLKLKTS